MRFAPLTTSLHISTGYLFFLERTFKVGCSLVPQISFLLANASPHRTYGKYIVHQYSLA